MQMQPIISRESAPNSRRYTRSERQHTYFCCKTNSNRANSHNNVRLLICRVMQDQARLNRIDILPKSDEEIAAASVVSMHCSDSPLLNHNSIGRSLRCSPAACSAIIFRRALAQCQSAAAIRHFIPHFMNENRAKQRGSEADKIVTTFARLSVPVRTSYKI